MPRLWCRDGEGSSRDRETTREEPGQDRQVLRYVDRVLVGKRSAASTFTDGTTIGAVFRDSAIPRKVGPVRTITGLRAFDCGADDDRWPEEVIDLARAAPEASLAVR